MCTASHAEGAGQGRVARVQVRSHDQLLHQLRMHQGAPRTAADLLLGCAACCAHYYVCLQSCRAHYQGQENASSACELYQAVGLGASHNRIRYKGSPDYTC